MPRYTTKDVSAVPVRVQVTNGDAGLDVQCDGEWVELLWLNADGEVCLAEHGPYTAAKLKEIGLKLVGSPSTVVHEGSQRVEARIGMRRLIAHPRSTP